MTKQTKTAVLLSNGDFFDFKEPRNHSFDIETIATALSNLCRYTGYVKSFYSVAEHSLLVSYLVPTRFALEGLMHDASEAYCGDVASPLKQLLPEYKEIEEGVQAALAKYYNLYYPFDPSIKQADKIAYVTERQSIANVGKDKMWYTDLKPDSIKLVGYEPATARKLFLARFEELQNARNAVLLSEGKERAAAA